MGFINKKAHNIRQDRFNNYLTVQAVVKAENIEADKVIPLVVEPVVVEMNVVENEIVESELVEKEENVQPSSKKKRVKKTQENNNIETIE